MKSPDIAARALQREARVTMTSDTARTANYSIDPLRYRYLICDSLLCADCATSEPLYCATICSSVFLAAAF